jgi:hypothetical protein
MTHISKKIIEDRAISGLSLQGEDVATVGRKYASLTLRHVWSDNVDGRVWDGIRKAYTRLARDLANSLGRRIDVYSKRGDQIDQISPDL